MTLRGNFHRIDPAKASIIRGQAGSAADTATELEFDRLRFKQRRHAERSNSNQTMIPAIKMLIGEWYVDEFGIPTREITARD